MSGRGTTRRDVMRMIGGATVAGGVLSRVGSARAAAGMPTISFGYQATIWGAPAIVAEEEQVFRGLKADVQIKRFAVGKAVRDAMIAGQMDMGSLGATPFIVGVAKGEIVSIGTVAYAGRTLMVVAKKGSGVKRIADLKGKKIGSQRGTATDHVFLNAILPKAGLSKDDVQMVTVSFQDHVSALASGSIDAFAGVDPYPTIAEHMGLGVILTDYADYDITPVIIAINQSVVTEKAGAVVEFLKGWLRSVRIFKEDPERATTVVWNSFKAQGYDVPKEVMRTALSHMDVDPEFVPGLKPYLQEQAKVLLEQKQINKLPDWDRALVAGPLKEAMRA